jgi:two-component sensor histidine kinase
VQAAVSLTKADTVADLKTAIEGRIKALANVNQLFVDSRWAGAELSDLVSQELAPYRRNEGGRRVRIEGANHLLEPGVAQALAVTVHELATNAAKYGALSTSDGKVEIAWELKTGGVLLFRWLESGGPPVRPPERQGFGTRVVATMIAQLLGHVEYDWQSSGLVCQITLPIAP